MAILWAGRRSEKLRGTRKTWPLMHSKSIMQIDLLFLYSSHRANDVLLNLMTSNMHVRCCCTLSGPHMSHFNILYGQVYLIWSIELFTNTVKKRDSFFVKKLIKNPVSSLRTNSGPRGWQRPFQICYPPGFSNLTKEDLFYRQCCIILIDKKNITSASI